MKRFLLLVAIFATFGCGKSDKAIRQDKINADLYLLGLKLDDLDRPQIAEKYKIESDVGELISNIRKNISENASSDSNYFADIAKAEREVFSPLLPKITSQLNRIAKKAREGVSHESLDLLSRLSLYGNGKFVEEMLRVYADLRDMSVNKAVEDFIKR